MKLSLANLAPKTWWQWVIYLIAIIIPNLGNISNFITSVQLDIPFSTVPMAVEQNKLWNQNCQCIQDTKDVLIVTTPTNIEVKFLICPNGDGLMQTKHPDGKTYARWVSPSSLEYRVNYSWLSLDEVYAMEAQNQGVEIICQWDDKTHRYVIYKHLATGKCYKKTINKYRGDVTTVDFPCINRDGCPCAKNQVY
jgi:hypothetical protein